MQLSHICHRLLLSVLQIYFVDIVECVYSSYKESLIMMSLLLLLSFLLLFILLVLDLSAVEGTVAVAVEIVVLMYC